MLQKEVTSLKNTEKHLQAVIVERSMYNNTLIDKLNIILMKY